MPTRYNRRVAPNPSVATAGVIPPGPRGLPALLDVVRRYRRDSLGPVARSGTRLR